MTDHGIDPFLSQREVQKIAGGKSRVTLWRWVRLGIFPSPVQIGPNSIGWRSSAVQEWAENPAAWRQEHSQTDGAAA